MKKFAVFAVLAALMTGVTAVQAKETPASTAVKSLMGVPAPEIAATVVKVVQGTPRASRPAVVDALVRRVAKTNPAVARSVVAAVAKSDPSMAPVAAAAAAKVNPSSVRDFVVAACTAAPDQAAQIVALCSRLTVVSRGALAEMVAEVNPAVNAVELAKQANQVRITVVGADAPTGGTILLTLPPGGDTIGYTMDGTEVHGDPAPVTGETGSDTHRDPNYPAAGS